MSRPLLDASRLSAGAAARLSKFHPEVVSEIERAVKESPVVVVGMSGNVHVKRVRKALEEAGVQFRYLEYGSYFAKWKERLAIKLWSGWPTFPQVFVRGTLIGGQDLTVAGLSDGTLKALLDGASAV
jgi:monothiol glutaredoxin